MAAVKYYKPLIQSFKAGYNIWLQAHALTCTSVCTCNHTHTILKIWHTTPIPCFTNVICSTDTTIKVNNDDDDEREDTEDVNGIWNQDTMNRIKHNNLHLKSYILCSNCTYTATSWNSNLDGVATRLAYIFQVKGFMWCFVFPTIDTEWCCIHRYLNTCWPIRVHLSIFVMETLQLEFKIRPVNTSLYVKAPDRDTDIQSHI